LKKLERQSINLIKRLQPKKPLEMKNNSSEEEVNTEYYGESPKVKNNKISKLTSREVANSLS